VKGEIFAVEQRESRDGRKLILSFDVTDYTSSLRVKYIAEREKAGEASESLVEGQSVLLKGDVEFDRFERDLSVRLSDLMLAEREEPADDAPEKRVELHLHTAMSSMDGINPVEDYIRQAAAWGHKAVAVTDHGVVQSFPDAMKAGKKFGVKILYGVEAYL
jgi:DNA polymerase-3 subunit alpha (Gram-positive type)